MLTPIARQSGDFTDAPKLPKAPPPHQGRVSFANWPEPAWAEKAHTSFAWDWLRMGVRHIGINLGGGPIRFEIVFGHVNYGGYRLYKLDRREENPLEIGHGKSTDHIPDKFLLAGNAQHWHNTYLIILANLYSSSDSTQEASDQYNLTVNISQNNKHSHGSPVFYSGEMLHGLKALEESLHFEIASDLGCEKELSRRSQDPPLD